MHRLGGGRDTEQGRAQVERHAVDSRRISAAAELIELLAAGNGKDANDSARLGRCSKHIALAVQGHATQGRAVRLNDGHGLERDGVKNKDLARGWRHEG